VALVITLASGDRFMKAQMQTHVLWEAAPVFAHGGSLA